MSGSEDAHVHDRPQGRGAEHGRLHGALDPALFAAERGLWVVKWSFVGLLTTALLQVVAVIVTGSVALLADTIHNLGDAATAIPLWIAFTLGKLSPTKRFTYGYGRAEDAAGVIIVVVIFLSGIAAILQSLDRLAAPQPVERLWVVMLASAIGFIGNELVAQFRIRVGKEIGSAALIADGNHARADGLTSIAVLFGAIGVGLGYPLADPLVGLLISAFIFRIVWETGKSVFGRLLDEVDPEVTDELREAALSTAGVRAVTEVRVRWLGHRLLAEINLAVRPELSVEEAHEIATEVQHQILLRLRYLSNAVIHVDQEAASGEAHHRVDQHETLPTPSQH